MAPTNSIYDDDPSREAYDNYKKAFPDTLPDEDEYKHYDKLFGSYYDGEFDLVKKYPSKPQYDN